MRMSNEVALGSGVGSGGFLRGGLCLPPLQNAGAASAIYMFHVFAAGEQCVPLTEWNAAGAGHATDPACACGRVITCESLFSIPAASR